MRSSRRVDDLDEALGVLEREEVHLILSDVRLRSEQTGIELARAAKERGVPTLFATGHRLSRRGRASRVGCLLKPYTERQLMQGDRDASTATSRARSVKPPKGLELYRRRDEPE